MERRKAANSKSSSLPLDYVKMIEEVFTGHFDAGLKVYNKIQPQARFEVHGEVLTEEVVISVSLVSEGQLAATTVYASADFDPKASSPTVEDLLSACVDAIGIIFEPLLEPSKPDAIALLADESLAVLENVPFHWTEVESNQRTVYLKIDKSNPKLDHLADEWLTQHDPQFKEKELDEQKETEKLFVTGPSSKNRSGGGSGMIH